MSTETQVLKPIIVQRAVSYGAVQNTQPLSSSSSVNSDDLSADHPISDANTLKSSASLPNCTTAPTPSISFAPLPTIEPRKRRSNLQLGVAARSRMLHQRRYMSGGISSSPMWTDLDEEAVNGEEGADPEDPFEVFGRFLVGKSKNLWRRVSHKGTVADKGSEVQTGKISEKAERADGLRQDPVDQSPPSDPESEPELDSVGHGHEQQVDDTPRHHIHQQPDPPSANPDSRAAGSSVEVQTGVVVDETTLVEAQH